MKTHHHCCRYPPELCQNREKKLQYHSLAHSQNCTFLITFQTLVAQVLDVSNCTRRFNHQSMQVQWLWEYSNSTPNLQSLETLIVHIHINIFWKTIISPLQIKDPSSDYPSSHYYCVKWNKFIRSQGTQTEQSEVDLPLTITSSIMV